MPWSDRIGRRVKLRDLHVLLAVAETRSMAKAAERLAISQPVVSKTIADLEHALGVRLLDRTSQGVEPTAYGHSFIHCGTAVFDEMRRGVQDIEFLADPTAGEMRIGVASPYVDFVTSAVLEDAIDIARRASEWVDGVGAVRDQATAGDEAPMPVDRGQSMPVRQRDNQVAMSER